MRHETEIQRKATQTKEVHRRMGNRAKSAHAVDIPPIKWDST
jgi:hypothetical protein